MSTAAPKARAAKLQAKQQAFVEEYLRTWNASEAARLAHYAHPGQQGHRLLKNVEIRRLIDARLSELGMGADEVLARLADQASSDMADFIVPNEVGTASLDLKRAAQAGKLHLIKKFSQGVEGTKIELYDAQAALVHLGRHHALFTDKVAPTDPTGTKPYDGLTEDERAERVAALLERARARRDRQPAAGSGG